MRTRRGAPKPVMRSRLERAILLCGVSRPGTGTRLWPPLGLLLTQGRYHLGYEDVKGDVGILAGKQQVPIKASMQRQRPAGAPPVTCPTAPAGPRPTATRTNSCFLLGQTHTLVFGKQQSLCRWETLQPLLPRPSRDAPLKTRTPRQQRLLEELKSQEPEPVPT